MKSAPIIWMFVQVASFGCLRETVYVCESSERCGGDGVCEPGFGFCSFSDPACETTRRFGDGAGSLANACVPAEGPPTDSGGDALATECPSDYVVLADTPETHRYKAIGMLVQWEQAQLACAAAAPGRSYLAVPDDAAELAAQTTYFGVDHWIGVHDRGTEGVFERVTGGAQGYQPFDVANGEPDDGMGGQDCVMAFASGDLIATDKCDRVFEYLCECDQ